MSKSPAPQKREKKHILVIRFSALGDVAMMVPVISVLTQTYPEVIVTILTRSFFEPLFSHIPNVRVYEADVKGVHSGVLGLAGLARELRDEEVDVVADLHDVIRSNILRSVFYFYGIPFKQIDKGRSEKKALTREENKEFKQLKSTHQRYADVFAGLGYPLDLSQYRPPKRRTLLPKVQELIGHDRQKWIGIAPFAQHESKMYPLDLMERVISELNAQGKTRLIFFGGGKRERDKLEKWQKQFENSISVVGKLSFAEELTLISNLDAMVSMDSGNAHLAAIYGIPVISLWGVTHPYTGFKAFNQPIENCILPDLEKYPKIPTSVYGNKIPAGYEEVMRSISPQKVLTRITEVVF
ncbi:ADP-heptose--LPS heptosyltransferase RfaF [Christiangramia fulva]|uniref:ADP-heptose--LPS heptosyltransferase RfaF n=1 Tax=Christiangramia fulva TaxID=2126553 RepID=A0A2R3Z3L0_9FLAO|nr:glycosyltransferase family 9 protein [Christiangramia fulva]AVR44860.1 ADP-heptose--LPS heptosyltransferase RfaF [Christiangramia fulva]